MDYFNNLTIEEQADTLVLFKRMGDAGKINNTTKFRNEGDKIFAFKPKPNRFLCFFVKGKKIIITNGFSKKQNKLPLAEKEKAITARKDYLNRIKEGEYDEE